MAATPNVYTRRWFSTFLGRIDPGIVDREIEFIRRQLPHGARVLDLCCGPGRHAGPLSEIGYGIIGLDRDDVALRDAACHAPRAAFVRGDMRCIPLGTNSVDGAICMWQSFGQFDDAGNRDVLGELHRVLAPNGRLLFDLYHRDFHVTHLGPRTIERDGERVHESRLVYRDRLRVTLRYESSGTQESFDWKLYTPPTLESVARTVGFRVRHACAEFDESIDASPERARMQILLEKV